MLQKRTVPFKQQLISGHQITSCLYPCYTLLSEFLGRFQGWGAGDFGQLGDNRATSSDRPVHVRGGWFLWFSQWPMANGRLCNLNTSGVTIKLGHATKITGVIDNIYIYNVFRNQETMVFIDFPFNQF